MMTHRIRRIPSLLLLFSLVVVVGCSGGREAAQTVSVRIVGEPGMNGGNAARVQIYQLRGQTRFLNADIEVFWREGDALLESELVRAEGVEQLYPDQSLTLDLNLDPETRYVGVAADLYEPNGEAWREVISVEVLQGKRVELRVTVTDGQLSLDAL